MPDRPPLTLHLTPDGRLALAPDADAPPLDAAVSARIAAAFTAGADLGLVHLGAAEVHTPLPAVLAFWRTLAARYEWLRAPA